MTKIIIIFETRDELLFNEKKNERKKTQIHFRQMKYSDLPNYEKQKTRAQIIYCVQIYHLQ